MNEQFKGEFEVQYYDFNFPSRLVTNQMNDFIDRTFIQHGFEIASKFDCQAEEQDDVRNREICIEFRCRADREWYDEASDGLFEAVLDGLDEMVERYPDVELFGISARLLP